MKNECQKCGSQEDDLKKIDHPCIIDGKSIVEQFILCSECLDEFLKRESSK